MSDLSPSAQAVLDAMSEWFVVDDDERQALADALRAAADQVECDDPDDNAFSAGYYAAVNDILDIAAELDNTSNTSEGIMAITQPAPVRTPDGKIHEFILSVDGKRFFCPCNCNVFHKPDDRDLELYQCNCCGTQFNSH